MNVSNETFLHLHPIVSNLYFYGAVVGVLLFFMGLISNSFLIYVFMTDRCFKKTTYHLILLSCISDIISILAMLYTNFQVALRPSLAYTTSLITCKILMFIVSTSYGVSIFNLCLIAIDRYFAIVKPLSVYYRIYKKRLILASEMTLWIASASLNAPIIEYITVYREDPFLCDISSVTTSISVYFITIVLFLYIGPMVVIASTYGAIIMHQKNYVRPGETSNHQRHQIEIQKSKFINMLIVITLHYILSTWPLFATFMGIAITRKSFIQIRHHNLTEFVFAFLSMVVTSGIAVVNPIIHFHFDYNIRKSSLFIIRKMMKNKQRSIVVKSVTNRTT